MFYNQAYNASDCFKVLKLSDYSFYMQSATFFLQWYIHVIIFVFQGIVKVITKACGKAKRHKQMP